MGETDTAEEVKLDSPLKPLDNTANDNKALLEMHYPQELDPSRAVPDNGYPYRDRLEREASEIRRAKLENRKPNLENPGPDAGSPLRSAAYINNPMNTQQASLLGHADPVKVYEPEDLGLVENDAGQLVQQEPEVNSEEDEDELTGNDSSDLSDSSTSDLDSSQEQGSVNNTGGRDFSVNPV